MEKLHFVKIGALRLPPGFRFHPTDEELVFQYLKRKVFSFPLPASIIPDMDVHKSDPWDLPGWFALSISKFLKRTSFYTPKCELQFFIEVCDFCEIEYIQVIWNKKDTFLAQGR